MQNANQLVLAQAFIARHGLTWAACTLRTTGLNTFYVMSHNQGNQLEEEYQIGWGNTLYAAVEDFQRRNGIGWGS